MKEFSSKKKAIKHAYRRDCEISEKNGKFIVKDPMFLAKNLGYLIAIAIMCYLCFF